jgi:hypothetical protein
VSEVSPGHLFKFQRLLKKFFIGPQLTNFMVHPIVGWFYVPKYLLYAGINSQPASHRDATYTVFRLLSATFKNERLRDLKKQSSAVVVPLSGLAKQKATLILDAVLYQLCQLDTVYLSPVIWQFSAIVQMPS